MTAASIFSGIGAPEAAWEPLGIQFVFNAEIEPFPCAVLKHHYPDTPNLGDVTRFEEWNYETTFDILVGGSPCQGFSFAGLRKGLDDPRSNLMLTFGAIAARYRSDWLVWENVPGVLSSNGGRDFACFLGLLTGQKVEPPKDGWSNSGILSSIASAYGVAWRVLDAQYFNLAQRRERVFVVGHIGGKWQRAAAVLLERASLRWNPAPSRTQRKDVAPTISARTKGGGGLGTDFDCDGGLIASSIMTSGDANSGFRDEGGVVPVPGTLGANHKNTQADQTFIPEISNCLKGNQGKNSDAAMEAKSLVSETFRMTALGEYSDDGGASAMKERDYKDATDIIVEKALGIPGNWIGRKPENGGNAVEPMNDLAPNLTKTDRHAVQFGVAVRRLTPVECCRLQGFSDDYLDVIYNGSLAKDGSRYRALGNSMAVPVLRWIGKRILEVDKIP